MTADVLAMFAAATNAESFGPVLWPHHLALWQLRERAPSGGALAHAVRVWDFSPSAAGGYAIQDLAPVLWTLSAEGWLRRENGCYGITEELRARGERLLTTFSERDRRALRACAGYWINWSVMASKKPS